MSSIESAATSDLIRCLTTRDRRLFDQLFEKSVDVIIFGSRAAGVHSRSSDLDILCVGFCERKRAERLDIVTRRPLEVEDRKWLGSELASHIAAYGIVIVGSAHWKKAVHLSDAAVSRKERRVLALVDGLWSYWDRIHVDFRRKYLTTIRREVQRLQLLREGIAVPPSPILDRKWDAYGASDSWIECSRSINTVSQATRDHVLHTTDLIIRHSFTNEPSLLIDASFHSKP